MAVPDLSGVTPGSPIREGSGLNIANLPAAVSYAVDHGAFAINLSANGSGGNVAELRAAMDKVRANDRILVQSVSNTSGEDSFAGQITESMVGADLANKDWFLFGLRVDASLQAPAGNGLPGALADRTLAVVATNVTVAGTDRGFTDVTGNSFAAPAIAGAAALLKQHWPQLGGKTIARILLDTATDLGAPGVDQQYGKGLMNIQAAMQAQAPALGTSAATVVPLSSSSLSLSGPFGGAGSAAGLQEALGDVVVLDRYGRDFRYDAGRLVRSTRSALLMGGMLQPLEPTWAPTPMNQSMAIAQFEPARRVPRVGNVLGFSPAPGQTVLVSTGVAPDASRPALTGSLLRTAGLSMGATSVAWTSGEWGARASAATLDGGRSRISSIGVDLPGGFGATVTDITERGRALGLSGSGAFQIGRSRTTLLTFSGVMNLGSVELSARGMLGSTDLGKASGLLRFQGPVLSSGLAFEAAAPLLGGRFSLGASSPLRVERARAVLVVPVGYDLTREDLITGERRFDLVPAAREKDLELGWFLRFAEGGILRVGLARAFDAGHVRGAQDTAGYLSLTLR